MNTIYKIVRNAGTGRFVAASELAKGNKKNSRGIRLASSIALALALGSPFAVSAAESCASADGQFGIVDENGACESEKDRSAKSVKNASHSLDKNADGLVNSDVFGAPASAVGNAAVNGISDIGIMANGDTTLAPTAGGTAPIATSGNGTAIGNATVAGNAATATGNGAIATGNASSAYGNGALASAVGSSAYGNDAEASGQYSVALGTSASAKVDNGVAVGNGSTVSGVNSTALGVGTLVAAGTAGSVAIGAGSQAMESNVVSVGNSTSQRRIVNVAAGTIATDVANFGQLTGTANSITSALGGGSTVNADGTITAPSYNLANGGTTTSVGDALSGLDTALTTANTNITQNTSDITTINGQLKDLSSGTIGLVKQDATTNAISVASDTGGTMVDFTGTDGARTLSGVAAGNLSAGSKDAVNGAQLFETNQNVAALDTRVGATETNITNLGSRVGANETNITNINSQLSDLSDGTVGLVRQAADSSLTVGGTHNGTVVNFAGTDGNRVLTGVANGFNDSDVATIAQLKAAGLVDKDGKELGAVVYDDMTLARATLGGTGGTVLGNIAPGLIAGGSMDAVNGGQISDLRDQLQGQIGNLDGRVGTIESGIADGSIGGGSGGGAGGGNAGGSPISNVGDGVAPSDAANVGQVTSWVQQGIKDANSYADSRVNAVSQQLDTFKGEVNNRFNQVDARISRVGAMSAAMSQMAFSTQGITTPNRVGMGVGNQGGKSAIAVGYSRAIHPNVNLTFGGSASGSEVNAGVGVGMGW